MTSSNTFYDFTCPFMLVYIINIYNFETIASTVYFGCIYFTWVASTDIGSELSLLVLALALVLATFASVVVVVVCDAIGAAGFVRGKPANVWNVGFRIAAVCRTPQRVLGIQ